MEAGRSFPLLPPFPAPDRVLKMVAGIRGLSGRPETPVFVPPWLKLMGACPPARGLCVLKHQSLSDLVAPSRSGCWANTHCLTQDREMVVEQRLRGHGCIRRYQPSSRPSKTGLRSGQNVRSRRQAAYGLIGAERACQLVQMQVEAQTSSSLIRAPNGLVSSGLWALSGSTHVRPSPTLM
jgi:hypothetical protein